MINWGYSRLAPVDLLSVESKDGSAESRMQEREYYLRQMLNKLHAMNFKGQFQKARPVCKQLIAHLDQTLLELQVFVAFSRCLIFAAFHRRINPVRGRSFVR